MPKQRYSGLRIDSERNADCDSFFDMMGTGETFRLTPLIDREKVEGGERTVVKEEVKEEVVLARILAVSSHPTDMALLVTLQTVETLPDRMRPGKYVLAFDGRSLVCSYLPEWPGLPDDLQEWAGHVHDFCCARA